MEDNILKEIHKYNIYNENDIIYAYNSNIEFHNFMNSILSSNFSHYDDMKIISYLFSKCDNNYQKVINMFNVVKKYKNLFHGDMLSIIPNQEDYINNLINNPNLCILISKFDDYYNIETLLKDNKISDEGKQLLFEHLFTYAKGDAQKMKSVLNLIIPYLGDFLNAKENEINDSIEQDLYLLFNQVMTSNNPVFIQKVIEKINNKIPISKIYHIVGKSNLKRNTNAINKEKLTSFSVDKLRKGADSNLLYYISGYEPDNINSYDEYLNYLKYIFPNFDLLFNINSENIENGSIKFSTEKIKNTIWMLCSHLEAYKYDFISDEEKIRELKQALVELGTYNEICYSVKELSNILNKKNNSSLNYDVSKYEKGLNIYNLDGQDFTFLIHGLNALSNERVMGIGTLERDDNLKYSLDLIKNPQLWLENGINYNDNISTSSINQYNIDTYNNFFGEIGDNLTMGFSEIPIDQIGSIYSGDHSTKANGNLRKEYNELYGNNSIEDRLNKVNGHYDEIVISRYLPNKEKRTPDYLVVNGNRVNQFPTAIKWANYFKIPIFVIHPEKYVERFNKEAENITLSNLTDLEKLNKLCFYNKLIDHWKGNTDACEKLIYKIIQSKSLSEETISNIFNNYYENPNSIINKIINDGEKNQVVNDNFEEIISLKNK